MSGDEALALVTAIDEGADPIVAADDWHDVFCGDVRFRTAAGHEVTAFNDCDGWDYLDSLVGADGRAWGEDYSAVSDWAPKHPERWGLTPGRAGAQPWPFPAISEAL